MRERFAVGALKDSPSPAGSGAAAAVFLATCTAFLPALRNGFVNWDDKPYLVDNFRFRGFGASELVWMFTTTAGGPYHPLTWLSFAVDFRLWGLEPFGFHLDNILLHAAAAVLYFFLCRRLLAASRVEASPRALIVASAAAALLFAVHPLRVESVAWAIERKDVLSGLFYLATLLAYTRRASKPPDERGGRWPELACFALAALSKGTVMTLPFALLILDVYPLDRRREGWRALLREKAPHFLLAASTAAVALLGQSRHATMPGLAQVGVLERAMTALWAAAFYLRKTAVPLDLLPLYPRPRPLDPLSAPFLASGAFILAASAALVGLRRRWPAGLAAWLHYLSALAPVSGLVPFGDMLAADRYSYLACLAWPAAAGGGLLALPARARPWGAAATCAAIMWLASSTWRQTLVWRDSETLWRHTLALEPRHATARVNLGQALGERGSAAEAEEQFREALRLDPRSVRANANLAEILEGRGEHAHAERLLREALRSDPGDRPSHRALAGLLERSGRAREAREHRKAAGSGAAFLIDAAPPGAPAPIRGAAAPTLGAAEAVRRWEAAVRSAPRDATAHNNLGNARLAQGDVSGAIESLELAARLRPESASIQFNLANALAVAARYEEALARYDAALRIDPNHAGAKGNRDEVARHGLSP